MSLQFAFLTMLLFSCNKKAFSDVEGLKFYKPYLSDLSNYEMEISDLSKVKSEGGQKIIYKNTPLTSAVDIYEYSSSFKLRIRLLKSESMPDLLMVTRFFYDPTNTNEKKIITEKSSIILREGKKTSIVENSLKLSEKQILQFFDKVQDE